jgi:hypothetical protein
MTLRRASGQSGVTGTSRSFTRDIALTSQSPSSVFS